MTTFVWDSNETLVTQLVTSGFQSRLCCVWRGETCSTSSVTHITEGTRRLIQTQTGTVRESVKGSTRSRRSLPDIQMGKLDKDSGEWSRYHLTDRSTENELRSSIDCQMSNSIWIQFWKSPFFSLALNIDGDRFFRLLSINIDLLLFSPLCLHPNSPDIGRWASSETRLRGGTMRVPSIFQNNLKGGSVRCHNFEAVWWTLERTITYMAVGSEILILKLRTYCKRENLLICLRITWHWRHSLSRIISLSGTPAMSQLQIMWWYLSLSISPCGARCEP
jgi:hypothetical protein